ncbi:hypothetical protein VTJ83DRAFT_7117 [Remersonia thermophila]|uniref:BZIP domain-containing protein n=1 Tax=Remersonia thermophila TaxID=72144 RepID=A0ABR4D2L6_9PEZI
MRYTHGDLPVLSAETYGGSGGFGSSIGPPPLSSRSSDPASKKRPRTRAAATPERSGDEKKRARGRPRVETQDETAADRRRTQIRLAQRAYRDRKEHTIQALENKVRILTSANEEMSNAFLQLHGFALRCGVLDAVPEFGRQLRETTSQFLSLARQAGEDGAAANPDGAGGRQTRESSHAPRRGSRTRASAAAGTALPAPSAKALPRAPAPAAGPAPELDATASATVTPSEDRDLPGQPSHPLSPFTYDPPIQDPLLPDDAVTSDMPLPHPPAISIPYTTTTATIPNPNPWLHLPPPTSYSSLESTFGRRLQRFALERALTLLTMPSPPPDYMEHVFGFCLLLESHETMVRRLQKTLARDAGQSLYYWAFPFYHLGGAGTHLTPAAAAGGEMGAAEVGGAMGPDASACAPREAALVPSPSRTPRPPAAACAAASPSSTAPVHAGHHRRPCRVGNSALVQIDKPATPSLLSPGPFTPQVTRVRDHGLDSDHVHMTLPGFGGEYFDCDEVELYLYQRGVVIPPGNDVVCVEVGNDDLERWTSARAGRGKRGAGGEKEGGAPPMLACVEWKVRTVDPPGVGDAAALSASGTAARVDPALMDGADGGGSTRGIALPFGMVMAPSEGPHGAVGRGQEGAGTGGQRQGRKTGTTRVVVDVMTLVKKLTARAICLGRTPGFKQIDLDTAFWAAVEASLKHGGVWNA